MLQLHQARNTGISTSGSNFVFGLIGGRRIFATMTLNRRAAKTHEAIQVAVGLPKSAVAPIPYISTHLLDWFLSLRTRFELSDIPITAITTP